MKQDIEKSLRKVSLKHLKLAADYAKITLWEKGRDADFYSNEYTKLEKRFDSEAAVHLKRYKKNMKVPAYLIEADINCMHADDALRAAHAVSDMLDAYIAYMKSKETRLSPDLKKFIAGYYADTQEAKDIREAVGELIFVVLCSG